MTAVPRPATARPRSPLPRILAAALFAGSALLPVATAAADEPPRFLIESIAVEGARRPASADIVRSEARLAAGREYSEPELYEAVYRVRRLPFVLAADLSLRKGSERGAYLLVISIEETNAGFFAADVAALDIDPDLAFALGYSIRGSHATRETGTAGFRLLLGPRGVFFGAVHDEEVQAGYTHYGLFGGRGSASFAVSYSGNLCCELGEILPLGLDPTFASWSLGERRRMNLAVDYPLGGNHALRAAATELRAETSLRVQVLDPSIAQDFADADLTRREIELKWVYDSRDDPLFPSHGTALSAGLELSESSVPVRDAAAPPQVPAPLPAVRSDGRMVALAAAGTRSWAITSRQSFSAGARLAVGRSEVKRRVAGGPDGTPLDLDTREASVEARHSWSLWSAARTRDAGDLRLETTAAYGYEATTPGLRLAGNPVRRLSAGTAVVFRNGWGIFRLGFTYLDLGGNPR